VGGTSNPGLLNIWVNNNQPQTSGWTAVLGSQSPYNKPLFPPTYSATQYATAYIYPIYMQDSITSVPGATDMTPGLTEYDTLRVWMNGTTGSASDAPNLDAAYFFPGPPPADANCQGPGGCFVYAGANYGGTPTTVSVAQNQQWTYTTPKMPGGTYTFTMSPNSTSDADLYVKINGSPTLNSFDCRPYYGQGQKETCTVTIPNGATVGVMINGYSAGTSAVSFFNSGNSTPPLAISQGQQWTYTSPKLPGGNYIVMINPSIGSDSDLYVKVNGAPSLAVYDCRPYY
jgi:hypothetical protein